MAPTVAIIILNWNGYADTRACLLSLRQCTYPAMRVILVDNGSVDGSGPRLQAEFPEVETHLLSENLGFAGGNNHALELAIAAGYPYALLLNNDTEVDPHFLEPLVAVLENDPQVAMAGPTIYYYGLPRRIWSGGGAIDWKRGSTRMLHLGEEDCGQMGSQPRPMDFVTGCALLVRLSVAAQIGLLDTRYFAYYEETDWCVRATQAGYRVMHVPNSHLWHKISIEARDASPTVHYYMTRNRLLFLRQARAGWPTWMRVIGDNLRILTSWTLRPKWRYRREQRRLMQQAIVDFCRGRFGPLRSHG